MPIKYEGEDFFVAARARKKIDQSNMSDSLKARMNSALETLTEVAYLSNSDDIATRLSHRSALLDTMTVVKVIMDDKYE